jgi:signal transduction histidine kinase
VRDARGRIHSLLGISRDITDRKRLEDELREKNSRLVHAFERLERLAALKDEFLSNVSHELRTPLTSIRSYAEILLNYPDEEPTVQREFLGIINEECQRLTNLLNDVLDLSKIEAGEMAWHVAPHGVGDFILPAVEVSRAIALGAEVAIETTIPEGLPTVRVDEDRFQQVVLNILSNAIRHSPKGGTVRVTAQRVSAEGGGAQAGAGGAILIQIADEGTGIAPEDLPHLFDKYFQTKAATRRRGGTGLGLAISREIVEAFGGKIWAESEPGRGSVFRFTIPREGRTPQPV